VHQSYWADDDPCQGHGTVIRVDGSARTLHLCHRGQHQRSHEVAFGSAGLGKAKPGDRRTPFGTFSLGRPRASSSGFKTFIEIKVPRRIGTAVGIHGPTRTGRFFGSMSTAFNWTAGCIAVGSDDAIDEIARFVRAHPRARIKIAR
jgi:murein L,D-transpeptidase YafK